MVFLTSWAARQLGMDPSVASQPTAAAWPGGVIPSGPQTSDVARTLAGMAGQTPPAAANPPGYGNFSVLDPNAGPTRPTSPGYGNFSALDPLAGPTSPPAAGYGDFSVLDPTLRKPWWQA